MWWYGNGVALGVFHISKPHRLSIYRHFLNISIFLKAILKNIDSDKDSLENIDIDKAILENIAIDKDIFGNKSAESGVFSCLFHETSI